MVQAPTAPRKEINTLPHAFDTLGFYYVQLLQKEENIAMGEGMSNTWPEPISSFLTQETSLPCGRSGYLSVAGFKTEFNYQTRELVFPIFQMLPSFLGSEPGTLGRYCLFLQFFEMKTPSKGKFFSWFHSFLFNSFCLLVLENNVWSFICVGTWPRNDLPVPLSSNNLNFTSICLFSFMINSTGVQGRLCLLGWAVQNSEPNSKTLCGDP